MSGNREKIRKKDLSDGEYAKVRQVEQIRTVINNVKEREKKKKKKQHHSFST